MIQIGEDIDYPYIPTADGMMMVRLHPHPIRDLVSGYHITFSPWKGTAKTRCRWEDQIT